MASDGNTAVNMSYQLLTGKLKSLEMFRSTEMDGFHLKKKTNNKKTHNKKPQT